MEYAACRPSAIAQTIKLWPRLMSPAVNTLGTLVRLPASHLTFPICVELDPELFEHPISFRAGESHRQQDEIGRENGLCAWLFDELNSPVVRFHFDSGGLELVDPAVLAPESLGHDRVVRLPPSSWADETRKTLDHCGQGLDWSRLSGGLGTISN